MNAFMYLIQPFMKSLDYEGRSTRKEFIIFYLGWSVINLLLFGLAAASAFSLMLSALDGQYQFSTTTFYSIFITGMVIASLYSMAFLSLSARRLRDAGINPWFATVSLIPLANIALHIICCTIQSKPDDRQLLLQKDLQN